MKLLIIGGSNSVATGGYIDHLCDTLKEVAHPLTVKNLAVGGTTTLSGIGRLYETFAHEEFDFILYEYTINDTGTFMYRKDGMQSYLLCLKILLDVAAKLYPAAVFVPLLLAEEIHFSLKAPNPIYNLQLSLFSALSVPYIDIRKWMAELFLGKKPEWLYKDAGHYVTPQATSIIGSLVAAHLLQLTKSRAESIRTTHQKFTALNICRNVTHSYMPAGSLLPKKDSDFQIAEAHNRLMHLSYVRMLPGKGLNIKSNMFPLAIYLKSDAHHDAVRLSVVSTDTEPSFSLQTLCSTCHADTIKLRFVYSSIPVPFLFGDLLSVKFTPTEFALFVPAASAEITGPVKMFDAFVANQNPARENYLDLVGVLFVKDE